MMHDDRIGHRYLEKFTTRVVSAATTSPSGVPTSGEEGQLRWHCQMYVNVKL